MVFNYIKLHLGNVQTQMKPILVLIRKKTAQI